MERNLLLLEERRVLAESKLCRGLRELFQTYGTWVSSADSERRATIVGKIAVIQLAILQYALLSFAYAGKNVVLPIIILVNA